MNHLYSEEELEVALKVAKSAAEDLISEGGSTHPQLTRSAIEHQFATAAGNSISFILLLLLFSKDFC